MKLAADTDGLTAGDYVLDGKPAFAAQRNDDEFFANFFKKLPDKELNLRFGGLNRVGTFACGAKAKPNDDFAVPTSLEVWVGFTMFKGSNPNGSCSVTVTSISPTAVEGCYKGSLTVGDKKIDVEGSFRAGP